MAIYLILCQNLHETHIQTNGGDREKVVELGIE